jgi:aminoglycoside phosphotransferase (APT) family kinase protein
VIWDWSGDDLERLAAFLAGRGITEGAVNATPIGDGHANLTFLVTDGTSSVVVRRPPPPPVPPGANDVLREARVMSALAATDVPVPEVLAVAEAGDLLDVPFYVMSYLRGVVFTDATPPALATPSTRREIAEDLIRALVALHEVGWSSRGLEDFGRPEGFNRRHLNRMTRLASGENGSAPDGFAPVAQWLADNTPTESGAALVHSDFRLGNIMLGADPPGKVLSVLDWELSTLGDPLLDVGYFLASYPDASEPRTPLQDLGVALLEDGYPGREELAATYARQSGRDMGGLHWYTTMAHYKLAALYQHSHRRALAGVGDPYFADPDLVPRFLAAARRTAGLE